MYEPETYPPKNQVPPEVILDALDGMVRTFIAGQADRETSLEKKRLRELEQ